ncbi:carboxylating nicotinate-nucleotide diphosphorylase [Dyella sp.]|uniref:carboxylating nicotinate-nucleotide diphosphorylase n=1 Tax=Dyella sp. TaxID=1869338 RepID=UPI002ED45668
MTSRPNLDPPSSELIEGDVARAFAEDIRSGDATAHLIEEHTHARAALTCREHAVIAGIAWFDACFRKLDPAVSIDWKVQDGDTVAPGDVICHIEGNARALLSAERSALNFLQLLSGTATATAEHVAKVAGTRTRVLDTRKTVPGMRLAQKYAVRCGGGHNHRIGLFDAILVKENHIMAAGSIKAAVEAGRRLHPELLLEVEVENFDELNQAIEAGADRIMLDNFTLADMHEAVRITAGRIPLEVSGNVDMNTIGDIAGTGVDFVSVGALTKHVRAVDLSLRLQFD